MGSGAFAAPASQFQTTSSSAALRPEGVHHDAELEDVASLPALQVASQAAVALGSRIFRDAEKASGRDAPDGWIASISRGLEIGVRLRLGDRPSALKLETVKK
jgi:hypothetical protein